MFVNADERTSLTVERKESARGWREMQENSKNCNDEGARVCIGKKMRWASNISWSHALLLYILEQT